MTSPDPMIAGLVDGHVDALLEYMHPLFVVGAVANVDRCNKINVAARNLGRIGDDIDILDVPVAEDLIAKLREEAKRNLRAYYTKNPSLIGSKPKFLQ